MFGSTPRIYFQHTVEGTWGEFSTPAGDVHFLLTKARLGKGGIDNERRLTSQLRPVREVLDPEKLNFNQLLQRDLDDHRVATQLIPYLLTVDKTGPSFFPPIMTVLLPFEAEQPVDVFPSVDFSAKAFQDKELPGIYWKEERASNAFRIRRMSNSQGELHEIKLGQVSWNDEAAKLVVLDGQHRAMALIAIDRTINGTWDQNSGTRFRHFYEHRIESILETSKNQGKAIDLSRIEIPVTVCWFPSGSSAAENPHGAARKLFVDVNKEARKPSEARLILLSDSELVNIFTRCMLNRLREDNPPLPLYSIEYDNPNDDSNRPVRWSAMADLGLLKRAIQFTAFCPPKYRQNMKQTFGGRLSESEMDSRMREELNLGSVLPSIVEPENIERDSIGNSLFPESEIDVLRQQFMKGWGNAILEILGKLLPYDAHAKALKQLDQNWLTDDAISSLARDAIYVGVGMYWTLRDSENYHKKQEERARAEHSPVPSKPDIVKAWETIDKKRQDFEGLRANIYCGKTSGDSIKDTNRAFDIMNTHACQLGAFLVLTSISDRVRAKLEEIVELAVLLTQAWNSSLRFNVTQSRKRLFIFDRQQSNSINRIPRLDPSLSVYFRYFWLELLCTQEAKQNLIIDSVIDATVSLRNTARRGYLDFLIREQIKSLKRSNPTWNDNKLKEEATGIEVKELRKSLDFWTLESKDDFDLWVGSASGSEVAEEEDFNSDLSELNELNHNADESFSTEKAIEDLISSIDDED